MLSPSHIYIRCRFPLTVSEFEDLCALQPSHGGQEGHGGLGPVRLELVEDLPRRVDKGLIVGGRGGGRRLFLRGGGRVFPLTGKIARHHSRAPTRATAKEAKGVVGGHWGSEANAFFLRENLRKIFRSSRGARGLYIFTPRLSCKT